MISTVTTSTITTITTEALSASLALIAIIALLILLIQKEILSASINERTKILSRVLNVAIYPLLISFVFIAFVKVAEVLN
jgi:Na+-driven multidrug efflux pump